MEEKIAEGYGARVRLALPKQDGPQLFLVVSSEIRPAGLVRARRGRIVVDGGVWVIAEISFGEAAKLRGVEGVAFVGGISLDPERFAAFSKLTGFDPAGK